MHYTRIFWKEVVISHNLFPLDAIGIPIKKRCCPLKGTKLEYIQLGIEGTQVSSTFQKLVLLLFKKTPTIVLVFGN